MSATTEAPEANVASANVAAQGMSGRAGSVSSTIGAAAGCAGLGCAGGSWCQEVWAGAFIARSTAGGSGRPARVGGGAGHKDGSSGGAVRGHAVGAAVRAGVRRRGVTDRGAGAGGASSGSSSDDDGSDMDLPCEGPRRIHRGVGSGGLTRVSVLSRPVARGQRAHGSTASVAEEEEEVVVGVVARGSSEVTSGVGFFDSHSCAALRTVAGGGLTVSAPSRLAP